jgi:hypothetical protein
MKTIPPTQAPPKTPNVEYKVEELARRSASLTRRELLDETRIMVIGELREFIAQDPNPERRAKGEATARKLDAGFTIAATLTEALLREQETQIGRVLRDTFGLDAFMEASREQLWKIADAVKAERVGVSE